MSRATKWKLEKAKVKVVFRLQFHATHIPQSGWEKLFISLIPTETGKATAKTSKANVRNGMCKWADPIYETTRLLLDSKSRQYDDKLYKLVVGMGTSRSSILGEAIINLADYADASQPSAIALPLHGSDHGTVLHVTVQLLTAKTGFREFEQQRDKGLQSSNNANKETEPTNSKSPSSQLLIPDDLIIKAKTQIQLRAESKEANTHVEYSDSQVTCDDSSNASENHYIDKHDSSSTHEVDNMKSRVPGSFDSPPEKKDDFNPRKLAQGSLETNNDLAIAYEENHKLRRSLEVAESSISELTTELSVLQSQANEMGTETQNLAQKLATEIASGQELAKEVTVLRSECSKFKNDLEQLKEMKLSLKLTERNIEEKKHAKYVNEISLIEDQIRHLQTKIHVCFCESDLSFLNSDFDTLLSTMQELKKGTVEPEIDSGRHLELTHELEFSKAERENLVRKMDQMECYYEGLVQELEENQKRILGEFQSLRNEHSTCAYTISTCKAETESLRNEMNDQMLRFAEERRELGTVNNELQRRTTTSESALKRARLNYSIAVGQLQKDLDMLSFQVLSMFETNQNVIKEAFSDTSEPPSQGQPELVDDRRSRGGDVLSGDLKKSLSLQENIYKKVEEELGEMCSTNLQLDVYSGTLEETLIEASAHIKTSKEKLEELSKQLELSNQSRDVLFLRLKTAAEDVHTLNAQNAYYLAKCNDLQLQNQMLETDLGNVSNENFLLMEKITECEALLMEYRVYKSKHEVLSTENLELENLLRVQASDNQNVQKDMLSVKEELETLRSELEKERDTAALSLTAARSEINDVKRKFRKDLCDTVAKLDMPHASLDKLQLQLDSVVNKFKSSFESEERHVENSEGFLRYLLSLELELQKMSFEDKNFVEKMTGLDMLAKEFEATISMLQQEKQDLMMCVESKNRESCELLSELDTLKERLRFLNDELEFERGLKNKHALDLESENSRVVELLTSLEKLRQERFSAGDFFACQLAEMHEIIICEDLKLAYLRTQYETQIEELVKELWISSERCIQLERKYLDEEARLNNSLEKEARYVEENETLATTLESLQMKLHDTEANLESVRLQSEASIAHNAELLELNNLLMQWKDSAGMLETKLAEVNNDHALEINKLKDMLVKSEADVAEYKELHMKFHDTEARLNHCLENEARYIDENGNLATKLESLRLELQDSIAHNAELLESNKLLLQWKDSVGMLETKLAEVNNGHALEISKLKDMLAKSEAEVAEYKELHMKLHDTETQLNHCLENEARYADENGNLATKLVSLRLELQDSIAHNAEILESNNVLEQWKDKVGVLEISLAELKNHHTVELGQLKDVLAKSESEVEKHRDLQAKLHDTETRLNELLVKLDDTESRLNICIENEARFIEENENLAMELESLRSKLEASIAHNAEISESNNVLEQQKDKVGMLEISLTEVKNQHTLELGRLKDMLMKSESEVEKHRDLQAKLHDMETRLNELQVKLDDTESRLNVCVENEVRLIEENENLTMELEPLRLKLEASIAHSAEVSESTSVLESRLIEEDEMLISQEESEIVLAVFKAKLDEQNDEMISMKSKCDELRSKLSEQILKTEELNNSLIYLKELKNNRDVAREKKDPEGPSESLRMAFIKEQYQSKVQDLKQQLSVSKRHGEEMLFKLQDALDEIETRKKSEASQLRRIEELEAEVESGSADKRDHDRIQAELECALLSLECCKEEKEKVVASLHECEEEKSKIVVELSSIRAQLSQKEESGYMGVNGSRAPQPGEAENPVSLSPVNTRAIQGISEGVHGDEENSLINNSKQLTIINDQFKAQHLRSCMEQLDEELEKMKTDNSHLLVANYDPGFQDLQLELAQLRKANEELGSIYPNFADLPGNGNALERVLALEIELAEALKTQKKPSIQFQSSFLKQHSDEEAVFKSFRDINELIKDMLEIKGKYISVESELNEMHDRYSQLSLQFAEVEGERQKLMMTLKNVRSSRNLFRLNRSSMAALEDHPA